MSSDTPNSIETIVCLANSRKISGRCVAGKRTSDNSWFRPISNRAGHEISEFDRRYSDGKTAQLLDVIEIPCIEERPHGHQSEASPPAIAMPSRPSAIGGIARSGLSG